MNRVQRWDERVSRLCLTHSYNRVQARISRLVSHTGDGPLYALVAAAALWSDAESHWHWVRVLLLAFALELPCYLLLKNLIRRRRPAGLPVFITPSDRYSLPSGHTAAAFLVAVVLGSLYSSLLLPLLVWAALVGASRLLLGVHYPSDLLAGALLGSGCARLALEWA
ncbi:phosphatase PAP2 family protein [Aeromonas diversa]|uniref:undecaprenyl-diphosphate phosphatase n=1 Tax=Aeromonas diversa CDC 2478-85 TaxID=1268237 RepID=N9VBD2_9GAMM|nr:phosphatase PAP2 family protein [Aeromonas diversa]ENY72557.1 hypothetical protein G114_07139 [Aeromonas diversa CDC 2478-85]